MSSPSSADVGSGHSRKPRSLWRLLAAVAVVAVAVVGAIVGVAFFSNDSPTAPEPGRVVSAYLQALQAEDIPAAYALLSSKQRESQDPGMFREVVGNALTSSGGITEFEIGDVAVTGNTAVISYTVTTKLGEESWEADLVIEDDSWLIQNLHQISLNYE